MKYEKTHGMTGTKIYWVFFAIKDRCRNKNNPQYKDYGGRGITCEWFSFEDFYKDMNPSYKEGLVIDRINNDGNYSKENCWWTDFKVSSRNKRNNIKYDGVIAFDASRAMGGCPRMIQQRIRRGWSIEKAFNTPKTER